MNTNDFDINRPIIGYTLAEAARCATPTAVLSPPHFAFDTIAQLVLPVRGSFPCRVCDFSSCAFTVWIDTALQIAYSVSAWETKRAELLDAIDTRLWTMDERWYVLNELWCMLTENNRHVARSRIFVVGYVEPTTKKTIKRRRVGKHKESAA